MSGVIIAGDTSGSVTLQAPAVAGTTVITLPSTSGTMITTAGGEAGSFTTLTTTGNTTLGDASTDTLNVGNGGLIKDASGNVGVGVPPNAWGRSYKVMQTPSGFAGSYTTSEFDVGQNYYDAGVGTYKYISSAAASGYAQYAGKHEWLTAASGTAGATFTFTTIMTMAANGNLTISGATATKASGTTWANPSDIRLKDNVTDYSKGLAELMQVNVKEWTYNGKGGTTEGMKGLGVIADEIMTVLPDTVDNYQAKLNADDEADTDIKKFDATEITWLMLNSIKEQQALITSLTARLDALENK